MKEARKTRRGSEKGIALLIAIFVLLLVSVVAIALLVSSGTETALGANYRSSSTVYYAALAGLEEFRGRLLPKNPNYIGLTDPSAIPSPFPLGQATYLINGLPGETVSPWDSSNPYYDNQYQTEFSAPPSSWQAVNSVWNNGAMGAGLTGPMFKWVRINAVTEKSIYLDVNSDDTLDGSTAIYYDSSNVTYSGKFWPSLVLTATPTATQSQALEITALAELPNGTQKYLQYLVAPITINIQFPAALTLDGYSDAFSGPTSSIFGIHGDGDAGGAACGTYPVPAIGVPDQIPDVNYVKNGNPGPGSLGIPSGELGYYTGFGSSPSVAQVTMPVGLQTVQSLDHISQTIIQNADSVIAGPANPSNLPSAMSITNPMTIAVQGDFHLTNGFTGYGLLLVTGNFTYDVGANWNGIVLVIGQGNVTAVEVGLGGQINGAMLIAQTRDISGNLLPGPNPGRATFNNTLSPDVGYGIKYTCSQIRASEAPLTYKVLSFHELPQP